MFISGAIAFARMLTSRKKVIWMFSRYRHQPSRPVTTCRWVAGRDCGIGAYCTGWLQPKVPFSDSCGRPLANQILTALRVMEKAQFNLPSHFNSLKIDSCIITRHMYPVY